MAEPVLTAKRVPALTGAAKKHPMATKTGIERLMQTMAAIDAWKACTKPQRALLAELCPPVVDRLVQDGQLAVEQLPMLPDAVRPASRAALERRGMVDEAGRLTGRAVHAWFYFGRLEANGGDHG